MVVQNDVFNRVLHSSRDGKRKNSLENGGGSFLMKTTPLLLIFLALGTLILSAEASSKLQLKTANFAKENRLSLQDLLSESGITHYFSLFYSLWHLSHAQKYISAECVTDLN